MQSVLPMLVAQVLNLLYSIVDRIYIGRIPGEGTSGLGSSAFVMQFTNSLVSIVCNSALSKYGGEVMVSVYTIINSVRQVLETPVIAIGEGTSPVISYNYGVHDHNASDRPAGAEQRG